MKTKIFVLVAILTITGQATKSAFALERMSGQVLKSYCEKRSPQGETVGTEELVCQGFLIGVASAAANIDGNTVLGKCVPNAVSEGQLVDVWLKYAREHPELMHLSSAGLVLQALELAWPCK